MQINFFNFIKGANTQISPFLIDPTELPVLNGANVTYKLGAILKDLGYSRVGAQIQSGKSALGAFNFRQDPSTEKMLITIDDSTSDDTQLFYKTEAGAWTEIGAAETAWVNKAGINVEMESFIGYCFFVGYGSVDGFLPVGSLTGTTFSTATNVTNMPQAKYVKRFRDRLYVANCFITATAYPYRVYFSSIPSAGAITWTQATDFFDVDYSEEITGMGEAFDRLLLFTQYKTYFYDQASFKKVWEIGCSNHRTIKQHIAYILFANQDGVWLSTGGQPQNISGNIIDLIRNSNPANWFAEIVDEEYHIYLGNTSSSGISYGKVVATYNIPANSWRWRELSNTMTIFAKYQTASSGVRLYMGDSDGQVWNKGKYIDSTIPNSDSETTLGTAVTPISVNVEFAPFALGEFMMTKNIDNLVAYADRALGVKLKARILDRNSRALTPYKPIGELNKYINPFQVNVDSGELLQLAIAEIGTNPYFSMYGFTLDVSRDSDTYQTKKV